jgi:hypothetical protein
LDRKDPPNNIPYDNEKQWKVLFARSNDVHICLHKNELIESGEELLDDYDFFYVGTHDENGDEIHRKDITKDEIYQYINSDNGFVDYRLIFLSTKRPTHYTVWVHSESKEWMKKITKPIDY